MTCGCSPGVGPLGSTQRCGGQCCSGVCEYNAVNGTEVCCESTLEPSVWNSPSAELSPQL